MKIPKPKTRYLVKHNDFFFTSSYKKTLRPYEARRFSRVDVAERAIKVVSANTEIPESELKVVPFDFYL